MADLKVVGPDGKLIPPPGQGNKEKEQPVPVPVIPQAQVIAQIEKNGDQVGVKTLMPGINAVELSLALLKLGTVLLEKALKETKSPIIMPG